MEQASKSLFANRHRSGKGLAKSLFPPLSLILCALAGTAQAQMRVGDTPSYRPVPPYASGLSPEDIVALPGTNWLIAGAAPHTTASDRSGISLIDTTNPSNIVPLYPAPSAADDLDAARFKDCPGPLTAGFAPHGINIEHKPDGSYDLIVVNHRGRESLEIFHIATDEALPRATWRGCVVLPSNAGGNSVAPLPGGAGYIATNYSRRPNPNRLQEFATGTTTGDVLQWTPAAGWSEIVPQQFSGANGVEVSPDGKWFFVSEWSDYKIWKFPLHGDTPPQTIHIDFLPDNLRLTDHGTILIAGQNADPVNVLTCRPKNIPCQAPFTVLEMEMETMDTHVLARGGDDTFGGATGAAMVGSSLWISSYYSQSIAHYELIRPVK